MSDNGRKRTCDMAFNTSPHRMSPVISEARDPKRRAGGVEQLWKKIVTDMNTLVRLYQKFAMFAVKSVDPPVDGIEVLDMQSLIKPTSCPDCVQRLVTAFTEEAYRRCFDHAFDALDYDIADNLCKVSRTLQGNYYLNDDARDGSPSPNRAQKRIVGKFINEAKTYLSLWEQMTQGDAMVKSVKAQFDLDPDAVLVQLIQLVIAEGAQPGEDLLMRYIKAAQVDRASDRLENCLAEVRPLTNALVSAYEDLEKLQK
jgi:hypothetical protein